MTDHPESAKGKETAKKKLTRKLNPVEVYERIPDSNVMTDEQLASRSLRDVAKVNEVLAHGFTGLDSSDLDPFDNERNYIRVCPDRHSVAYDPVPGDERSYNKVRPAPGYGAKEKRFDQDDEDYGHDVTKESDHQDD